MILCRGCNVLLLAVHGRRHHFPSYSSSHINQFYVVFVLQMAALVMLAGLAQTVAKVSLPCRNVNSGVVDGLFSCLSLICEDANLSSC